MRKRISIYVVKKNKYDNEIVEDNVVNIVAFLFYNEARRFVSTRKSPIDYTIDEISLCECQDLKFKGAL